MYLAWQELKKHLDMAELAEANLYLGCKHTCIDLQSKDGLMKNVLYGMKDYLMSSVGLYQKHCMTACGKKAALRSVATPFIEEGQARALAKAPIAKGPCIECE